MDFERLLGPNGMVPILIRDDDTNYFTKTEMLDSIYSKAWEKGFKVSLAVVPFQAGTDDIIVPPNVRGTDSHFSVSDNIPLTHYLRDKIKKGAVEVLQHGFTHSNTKEGRGEFGKDLDKKDIIGLGRNIIKQAFEVEPNFFVPPGEDISKKNLITLVESGIIPIYRQTLFDTFLRESSIPTYIKDIVTRILSFKYKNRGSDRNWTFQLVKPVLISVSVNLISWTLESVKSAKLSSFEALSDLTEKVVQSCKLNRSPVCILNHYHLYYHDWDSTITNKDLFQAWRKILADFDGIEFGWKVTFSDLYNRAKQVQNIQIIKTGTKITVVSETPIQDFSFRTRYQLEPTNSVVRDEDTNIITIEDLSPQSKITLYEKI
jgi:hypothetical protein